MIDAEDDLTQDTFFNGRIKVLQRRTGYRFSVDAVLLAHHVRPRKTARILDLGCGSGIIGLLLSALHPDIRIYGAEIQPGLAGLAQRNAAQNGLSHRLFIRCADMRELRADEFGGPLDHIVSNPPFRKVGSGRINPEDERAAARHEIRITLPELLETARRLLRVGGRFSVVYPAPRAGELLSSMTGARIEPKILQVIYSRQGDQGRLVLVTGTRGAQPGMRIEPALFLYNKDGRYTEAVAAMFSGAGARSPAEEKASQTEPEPEPDAAEDR